MPAFSYAHWHRGHDVELQGDLLHCKTCRVTAQLETIAFRLTPRETESISSDQELPDEIKKRHQRSKR